jgi:hypothetical protein
MLKKLQKIKEQNGYAILFTVVIVSAISVITAGLANTAYKQLILSSLSKDSQSAFYQADTAEECGLYADRLIRTTGTPAIFLAPTAWTCGGSSLMVTPNILPGTDVDGNNFSIDTIYPVVETATTPCFRIEITRTYVIATDVLKTSISSKGYNICNKSNLRTVEREVLVKFQE